MASFDPARSLPTQSLPPQSVPGTARRAVCPGSFDPVTLGHLDLVGRAAAVFDEVVVAVGTNPSKRALFSPEERISLLREACDGWSNVSVQGFRGLLVDFCVEQGIGAVVKGVRSGPDLEHELPMAQMNAALTGLETVLLPTRPQFGYVSSSLVREVAALGGDVSPYLSPAVLAATRERLAEM